MVKVFQADDICPQAVAKHHTREGDEILGIQRTHLLKDNPHKGENRQKRSHGQGKKDREEKAGKPQTTPPKNGKIRHPHHKDYPGKIDPRVVQPKNHLQVEPHKEELHTHANHRYPHGLDHGDLLKEKNSQRNEQEEISSRQLPWVKMDDFVHDPTPSWGDVRKTVRVANSSHPLS